MSVAPNDTDRRRFLLASAMTLLALPALWWANKQSDTGAPNVATVGIEVADADVSPVALDPAVTDPVTTPTVVATTVAPAPVTPPPTIDNAPPVFLDGPSTAGAVGPPVVGTTPAPAVATITSRATYRSTVSPADTCLVSDIATGTRITVMNLDNGHSVECVATRVYASAAEGIVLSTDTFAKIADLTDAPIPVEITP